MAKGFLRWRAVHAILFTPAPVRARRRHGPKFRSSVYFSGAAVAIAAAVVIWAQVFAQLGRDTQAGSGDAQREFTPGVASGSDDTSGGTREATTVALTVRAVTATGAGVETATVSLRPMGAPRTDTDPTARTDAQGECVFRALTPGLYEVTAVLEGYAPVQDAVEVNTDVVHEMALQKRSPSVATVRRSREAAPSTHPEPSLAEPGEPGEPHTTSESNPWQPPADVLITLFVNVKDSEKKPLRDTVTLAGRPACATNDEGYCRFDELLPGRVDMVVEGEERSEFRKTVVLDAATGEAGSVTHEEVVILVALDGVKREIQETLDRYRLALEQRDLAGLLDVYPTADRSPLIGQLNEGKLRSMSFNSTSFLALQVDHGGAGTARVTVRLTQQAKSTRKAGRATFTLVRRPGGRWHITDVHYQL